jgi:hypothetical protein
MEIFGKSDRVIDIGDGKWKWETIKTPLYMIGVFNENGELIDFVRADRPSTYRVYQSIDECKRGIAQNRKFYANKYNATLKIVQISEGTVVDDGNSE